MGKTTRLRISTSEGSSFRTCKKRWGFEYVDRLRPIVDARAPEEGRVMHGGIDGALKAAFAEGVLPFDRFSVAMAAVTDATLQRQDAYHASLLEAVEAGFLPDEVYQTMMRESLERTEDMVWSARHGIRHMRDDITRLVLLGSEYRYSVPVLAKGGRASILFHSGVIDVIWYDPETCSVIVDDHKSSAHSLDALERRVQLDPQGCGYVYAVRWLVASGALKVPGPVEQIGLMRYNGLRTKAPGEPKINQNGKVSVAAIDTLPDLYASALDEQVGLRGIPVDEKQVEILRGLVAKGDTFWRRLEFFRTDEDIEEWKREFWAESRMMRMARKDPSMRTRSPEACTTARSGSCSYRLVCMSDGPETRRFYRVREKSNDGNDVDQGQQNSGPQR